MCACADVWVCMLHLRVCIYAHVCACARRRSSVRVLCVRARACVHVWVCTYVHASDSTAVIFISSYVCVCDENANVRALCAYVSVYGYVWYCM